MQTALALVLNGKKVAGIKLKDDFDHLGFNTANLPNGMKICELQDFFTAQNHQPNNLSQLASHLIGTAIYYRRMLGFKEAGCM